MTSLPLSLFTLQADGSKHNASVQRLFVRLFVRIKIKVCFFVFRIKIKIMKLQEVGLWCVTNVGNPHPSVLVQLPVERHGALSDLPEQTNNWFLDKILLNRRQTCKLGWWGKCRGKPQERFLTLLPLPSENTRFFMTLKVTPMWLFIIFSQYPLLKLGENGNILGWTEAIQAQHFSLKWLGKLDHDQY